MVSLSRFTEIFKMFGKVIRLAALGEAYASGIKQHSLATNQQFTNDHSGIDLYDDWSVFLSPLQQNVQAVAAALDGVPGSAKANVETYLSVIAPEFDRAPTASTTNVLAAVIAQMQAAGYTVQSSGSRPKKENFAAYFGDQFNVSLPQSGSPTFADSLITTVVV